MKERIAAITGDQTARRLWMGTFHSIFSVYFTERGGAYIGLYLPISRFMTPLIPRAYWKSIIKEMQLDDKVYLA